MRRMKYICILPTVIFLILSFFQNAFAWPPIFGPEWEFTNEIFQDNSGQPGTGYQAIHKKTSELLQSLKETCQARGDCVVEEIHDVDKFTRKPTVFRITYSDGWWFNVSYDPGCIEVQAKPATVLQYKRMKRRIDGDVFGVMRKAGLDTFSEIYGGGHIHIGVLSAGFQEDPLLFRNFIVDFVNHSELATGVLEDDFNNAMPVSEADGSYKNKFAEAIERFDRSKHALDDLKVMINSIPNEKYMALNLQHLYWDGQVTFSSTAEVRSLRMQRNMEHFILETELFEKRIAYLKKFKSPIPLFPLVSTSEEMETQISRFRQYVLESSLSWKRYKRLLTAEYQEALSEMKKWEHPLPDYIEKPQKSDREGTFFRCMDKKIFDKLER